MSVANVTGQFGAEEVLDERRSTFTRQIVQRLRLDTSAIAGGMTVRFADGTERYMTLGDAEVEHPALGEVIFADEANQVHARRWCFRQSDQSAVRDDTTEALVTVEAHHERGRADVEAAVTDLRELLARYAGVTDEPVLLDGAHGEFASVARPGGHARQGR